MRTISLIPSHLHVGTGEFNGRAVGVVTLAGSGQLADVVLEVTLDQAAMAALEAGLSEARVDLRNASV